MIGTTTGVRRRCLPNGGGVECIGCGKCKPTVGQRPAVNVSESVPELIADVGGEDDEAAFRRAVAAGAVGNIISRPRRLRPLSGPALAVAVSRLDREWLDPAIRAEFGDDYEAFVAYSKHNAAGDITICGARR